MGAAYRVYPPLQGGGLAFTERLLCAGAVFMLNPITLALPPGGHCCSHFSGALRGELTCPRSLSLSVAGGEGSPGLADQSLCSFPGPMQEGHGDLYIRGAGPPDIGGGTCADPNGAESTFSSTFSCEAQAGTWKRVRVRQALGTWACAPHWGPTSKQAAGERGTRAPWESPRPP